LLFLICNLPNLLGNRGQNNHGLFRASSSQPTFGGGHRMKRAGLAEIRNVPFNAFSVILLAKFALIPNA